MSATTSDLNAVISDAAYYLIPQLTAELKDLAKTAGWPTAAINSLSVAFDGSTISVDYPPQTKQMIEDLEYGNYSNRPNSVIRSFIYRSDETVRSVIAGRSLENLLALEGVLGG